MEQGRGAGPQPRTVAECLDDPAHAGPLDGAHRVGEAGRDGRVVRIGLWRERGSLRARFKATSCASLIAYAEVACAALEEGAVPDAAALLAALRGVHPAHEQRADIVAAAVRAAFAEEAP
jgi:NifU-like protein involved in Fe-S cluster formation